MFYLLERIRNTLCISIKNFSTGFCFCYHLDQNLTHNEKDQLRIIKFLENTQKLPNRKSGKFYCFLQDSGLNNVFLESFFLKLILLKMMAN